MNLWLLPPYLHISSWSVPTQGDIDDDRAADQSRDYDPLWGVVDDDNVDDDDDDYADDVVVYIDDADILMSELPASSTPSAAPLLS